MKAKKSRRPERSERVTLLLTPSEKLTLEAYAALSDQSITATVRSILSAAIPAFGQKEMPK